MLAVRCSSFGIFKASGKCKEIVVHCWIIAYCENIQSLQVGREWASDTQDELKVEVFMISLYLLPTSLKMSSVDPVPVYIM